MFVRCSHPNVSTFSDIVSTTGAIFSPNVSRVRTMFVRRRRDVCESLQVRFPGAIVPRALAPPEPSRAPGGQVGQPQVEHRCLANAPFATEEDALAVPGGGTRKPPLQGLDFGLAPDDGPCSCRRE